MTTNKKKVYVAGKFTDPASVNKVQEICRQNGCEVTYDWTKHVDTLLDPNVDVDDLNILKEKADADIQGVLGADFVIVLFLDPKYAYRGTWTEIGIAIGKNIPVYIVYIDEVDCYFKTNIFFYSSKVLCCPITYDTFDDRVKMICDYVSK